MQKILRNRNHFRKALGIILFIAIIFTALSSAVSATIGISPLYQHISAISASLSIASNGLATAGGTVLPSTSNSTTTLTVELQRQSGNTWEYLQSWSNSGSGTRTIAQQGQRFVVRGTYRVLVTAVVRCSSTNRVLETATRLSHEITH